MIHNLLQQLQTTLAAIPELMYVDENWGQLDYYNTHKPVKYPLVLIDIGAIQWTNRGIRQQIGSATITLDVANLKLSNSNIKAPDSQRAKAFAIIQLLDVVHDKLQAIHLVPGAGTLMRSSTQRVRREDGIQHYRISYTCTVQGNATTGVNVATGAIIGIEVGNDWQ
jgi:hypothetical protein